MTKPRYVWCGVATAAAMFAASCAGPGEPGDWRFADPAANHPLSAQPEPCGEAWENVELSFGNRPTKNFGCAVQHNIAAQAADPRDFERPRPETDRDATRRAAVMGKYEKGEVTSAAKTEDQSGKVSDVGK
jgi:hypothetical protein